ncbi:Uncharacterized protein SCF082_LOCUS53032 [Durusdinium trenchii]|uniref:Swiss Army Knife RNA repair protein HAD domain-containing protein n=1 Tax=Durusdinium trenchii TaxID=1381693 RepID=A0ABP0SQC2_9DINO
MVTTLPSIPSSESVHLHHFKRRGHDDSSGLSPVGTDDSDEADEYETKAPSGAWRRQLSPCSVFSAASSGRLYAEPAQTLIFLDWDDTIFPCTEIFTTRNYTRRSREWTPLPPDLDEELSAWRQAAGDFLQAACAISDRCVILTNSRPPWVSACIDHFAPNLKEILAKNGPVRVVYASEMMKKSKSKSDEISEKAEGVIIKMLQSLGCFHGFVSKMVESMAAMRQNAPKPHFDLTEAKFKAMRKEAESFYSQYQGQTWKNIISLGDMAYEHDAAKSLSSTRVAVSQPRERLRTKSVVLLQSPSLHGLTLQLRIWSQLLPICVRFDGDIDLYIESSCTPFTELAKALQVPSLARVKVPAVYTQPDMGVKTYVTADEERAADELLDNLPILLHEAVLGPPRETFVKAR